MRVVVTGGAGFIGSHVVDELVDAGHDVTSVDVLLPAAHDGAPEHLHPGAHHLAIDVRDGEALLGALSGADAVCHQAAMVGLGVDFDDVRDYVGHNDLGTATLLWALHRLGFGGRLVVASSMVVYGEGAYRCVGDRCDRADGSWAVRPAPRDVADLEAGVFEPRCPSCGGFLEPGTIDECAPLDPRNVYAATKLQTEHLSSAFVREHPAVALTALRYHNVYGPRMPRDTPYAGVASIFRSSLERGEAPRVFEDGGQRRDFVHVRDVAHANVLALTSAAAEPGVYNIASGTPHTVLDMAATLAGAMGGPTPEVVGGYRLGDVRHVVASAARAASGLGFTAAIDFGDGMREFATAPLRSSSGRT